MINMRMGMLIRLCLLVVCWELIIVFPLFTIFTESNSMAFQYAARYAARTSFVLFVIFYFMLGWFGAERIMQKATWKERFRNTALMFVVNHVVHLSFVCAHYILTDKNLFQVKNLFGVVAYLFVLLLGLLFFRKVTTGRTPGVIIFVTSTYIALVFTATYLGRICSSRQDLSPKWLYWVFLCTIMILITLNFYRIIRKNAGA